MSRICAGLRVCPDAPFVDVEFNVFLILLNNFDVLGNHLAHFVAVADNGEILFFGKSTVGTLRAVPVADRQHIVMKRNMIHMLSGVFEQHLSPMIVKIV